MIGTKKFDNGRVFSTRIAGTSALGIGLVMIVVWGTLVRTTTAATICAIGEYLFFIGVFLFVASLMGEMKKVKIDLVLLDEE